MVYRNLRRPAGEIKHLPVGFFASLPLFYKNDFGSLLSLRLVEVWDISDINI